MFNQITINKAMRESVEELKGTDGVRRTVLFRGKTGVVYEIRDWALNPDSQVVEITMSKRVDGVDLVQEFDFPAADFELLVELMSLEKRGMRKVEDED